MAVGLLSRLQSALGVFILDALFPLSCVSCDRVSSSLCSVCFPLVLDDPWPPAPAADVYTCFAYAHPAVRRLLTRYKYSGEDMAGERLVTLFTARLRKASFLSTLSSCEAIVALPLSRRKMLDRGFNQADVLAEAASAVLGISWHRGALLRREDGAQQAGKTAEERRLITEHSPFMTTTSLPRTVLLIDDVYTTGATAASAISALRAGGVERVFVLTYAQGALH